LSISAKNLVILVGRVKGFGLICSKGQDKLTRFDRARKESTCE
jgi:hypothetical protein